MSPEVARRVIKLFREIRPPDKADYKLTPHELRLLKLLVEGHNYQTAAAAPGGQASQPSRSICATSTRSCKSTPNQKQSPKRFAIAWCSGQAVASGAVSSEQ